MLNKKTFYHWPILFVFVVVFCLFVTNVKVHTWLIGWDSYTPNLNFSSNFQRNIFGIWQSDRGVGLLDGMSHIANLIHTTIIFILSLFLPGNMLRYVFQFLCLFFGSIGMYFLTILLQKKRIPALMSSLFYMLNIGTIQMFYLPLEVFSVHFMALPWLTLNLLQYLKKPSRISLFFFFLLSFLFSPQSYVPTVFGVYVLLLGTILLFHIKSPHFWKKTITILAITFVANAFWAVPYLYSMTKNVVVISQAKINQMSNESILMNNQEFGDIKSVALIQGLYLSFINQDNPQQPVFIMEPWINHFQNPVVIGIAWVFFILASFGALLIIIKRKRAYYPFLLFFIFAFLMLANDTPYISTIFNFLVNYIPIFGSAYRFVFTKFSILYVFSLSILLSMTLNFLLLQKWAKIFLTGSFLIAIFFYSLPAFTGNLFYDKLRLVIPENYFSLIQFFNHQHTNERIAILPQPDFWGWTYNTWGFVGSGFIWQGLPQPVMDGAFLPWSSTNETYYLESSTAIYSKDISALENVLQKYGVRWLVIDPSIKSDKYFAGKSIGVEEIRKLIALSQKIHFSTKIGDIEIYKVDEEIPSQTLTVTTAEPYLRKDVAYNDLKSYIAPKNNDQHSITFPFQSVLSERNLHVVKFGNNQIEVTSSLSYPSGQQFSLPSIGTKQKTIFSVHSDYQDGKLHVYLRYPFEITDNNNSDTFDPSITYFDIPTNNQYQQFLLEFAGNKVLINKTDQKAFVDLVKLTAFQKFPIAIYGLIKQSGTKQEEQFLAKKIQTIDISDTFWMRLQKIEQQKYNFKTNVLKAHFFTIPMRANLSASQATYNCDILTRGEIHKENKENEVVYVAKNKGNICDNFGFSDVDHSLSYFLEIKGKNTENRSVNLYLHNWLTERNDLETLLPKNEYEQYFSILSQPYISGNGYSVNLETRSFERKQSENSIREIAIFPAELELLSKVKVIPDTSQVFAHPTIINDEASIDWHMYNSHIHTSEDESPVVLQQGFDSGWLAFSTQTPLHFFPHFKYNGWENAWLLPKGEYNIIIFYWPELLSFAGYAILLITFLTFGISFLKKKY